MSAPQGPRPGDHSDAAEPGTTPPGPSQGSPGRASSGQRPPAAPESGGQARPGPLTEAGDVEDRDGDGTGPREHTPRINPARMEVRVRRIALLGLVLVPLVYFIVQSLR
ncbi:hypothetical protein GR184_08760 [Bacillus sp. BGMRC0062]|nr:hypothetical protein [Bacillus sp. BGMRC0062]